MQPANIVHPKPHFIFSFDEQGRKEGAFKEFDSDGKVVVAANYVKGKLDGAYRRLCGDGPVLTATRAAA